MNRPTLINNSKSSQLVKNNQKNGKPVVNKQDKINEGAKRPNEAFKNLYQSILHIQKDTATKSKLNENQFIIITVCNYYQFSLLSKLFINIQNLHFLI